MYAVNNEKKNSENVTYNRHSTPESVLSQRSDPEALRINKMLSLADLSRTEGSPIKTVCDMIRHMNIFNDFENVEFPRIVSVKDNFDILNISKDHPSRRKSDTYYIDEDHVLRTQTTTMWPYYFREYNGKEKLEKNGYVKALSYGTVYRKDTVDKSHFPVFHQIDGLYICDKSKGNIDIEMLNNILIDIAKCVYGEDVKCVVREDSFPFTDPSTELHIEKNGKLIEVLGAGIVEKKVLENFGISPQKYHGWAFGFGLERLVMAKIALPDIRLFYSENPTVKERIADLSNDYQEVSKYPSTYRDITFIIPKNFNEVLFHELVRDSGENKGEYLVEDVSRVDEYINDKKFGENKKSVSFRITYRSNDRTLTNDEINIMQERIRHRVENWLGGELR